MGESGLNGGCGVFGEGLRVGWEGFRLGFEGGFEVVLSSVQRFTSTRREQSKSESSRIFFGKCSISVIFRYILK